MFLALVMFDSAEIGDPMSPHYKDDYPDDYQRYLYECHGILNVGRPSKGYHEWKKVQEWNIRSGVGDPLDPTKNSYRSLAGPHCLKCNTPMEASRLENEYTCPKCKSGCWGMY